MFLMFPLQALVTRSDCINVTSSPPQPPPLVVMTMNLRTLPNPKTHQNEVRFILSFIFYFVEMLYLNKLNIYINEVILNHDDFHFFTIFNLELIHFLRPLTC